MTRNLKRTFTATRFKSGLCFLALLIAPGVIAVTAITLAVAGNNRVEGTCNPVTLRRGDMGTQQGVALADGQR